MKVVIMAGGKGTRIASVKSDVPKPMIPIAGKPILEWQIENLIACGLTDITLVIGYLGHVIKEYFGDGSKYGVKISYFVEESPLGTAGALFKMPELTEDFLLLCGDVIINVDFNRFIDFHKKNHAWASLMAHPNGHPYDSSLLVTAIDYTDVKDGGQPKDTHRVIRWMNKEDERIYYKNRVNAGIEIISPELLKETMKHFVPRHPDNPDKIDLDRDVLKPNIALGRIYAYDTPEYIKDMGTPDRFYEAEKDIKSGKVHARNLQNKQKAIFLDRDGTINKYVGFLTSPDQFELIEGAAEAIKRINKSGYLAIVVTNQPVIARGGCTWEKLQSIHDKMETELGKVGALLDGIYICPHHPDKGFEGERIEYKYECDCRKPAPGLLLQAAKDFNIDLSQSVMIGDSERDIEAGKAAGCRDCLKLDTNANGVLLNAVAAIQKQDIFEKRRSNLYNHYSGLAYYILDGDEKIYLKDSQERHCRFCGKDAPDVKFKQLTHAISEMVGNKILFTEFECDDCNHLFSTLENDLGGFMHLYHTLCGVDGKQGVPKYKPVSREFSHIERTSSGTLAVNLMEGDHKLAIIDEDAKSVTFEGKRSYVPRNVYKALTKMAMSIMPESELRNCQATLKWLHGDFDWGKTLYCHMRIYPFSLPDVTAMLFKKREYEGNNVPAYMFVLAYNRIMIQTFIPCCDLDKELDGKKMDFCIVPSPLDLKYFPISQGCRDLSSKEKVKKEDVKMTLVAEKMERTL